MTDQKNKSLALVVSVYNEEKVIEEFYKTTQEFLSKLNSYDSQLIFVNDGSRDNSQAIIDKIIKQNETSLKIKSIQFSRNFGHEAAMIAGIDYATNDIIICMDSDLQHPPSMIEKMLETYEKGNDIVLMSRTKRHDNGMFKNVMSSLFYKLIDVLSVNKLEKNASDFFLISKDVASILKENYRERNRFLRGFIQVIGFDITTLEFEAPARFAGESNYSFKGLAKLGFTAIFAFSNKPLKISLFFSVLFFLFSLSTIIYSLIMYFWSEDKPPEGYTTIIIFMSIGFTILSIMISILSIYFGRSLDEIRNRPVYLVKKVNESGETSN